MALQAAYLMYWTLFKAALHHFNGDPFGIVFEPQKDSVVLITVFKAAAQHCNSALVPHSSLNPIQDTDCC